MSIRRRALYFASLVALCSCRSEAPVTSIPDAVDEHTYAQPSEASVSHLSLELGVDFSEHILSGTATYTLVRDTASRVIVLDTRDLDIERVEARGTAGWVPTDWQLGTTRPHLGAPLTIPLDAEAEQIRIHYRTSPTAAALQWLQPQQTLGKKHPFLFTQGQAILTRTWIPCQDSPGIRFTYDATIQTPPELMAVMSASNPTERSADGTYSFTMEQPIPAYLMALAVGDIAFDSIGPRTGVYAEPGGLAAATYEMADLEKMVQATEALYGPYLWDRFDLIILPPSFPFGGMENPRLTFATPTIIAGDRSLTSLVAHELAHSWSGNLVTNATWEDFWLNEGFTVYLERRIMESLYGRTYTDMLALLGRQDLERTVQDFGPDSKDTHLKLDLTSRDPDDGMTDVAYEKGYLLLRTIEERVGRPSFDEFLRAYFEKYKFRSISTEQWLAYAKEHLPFQRDNEVDLDAWIYGPGIPDGASSIRSERFEIVDRRLGEFQRIGRLDRSNTRGWSTHEWLHFIRRLSPTLHADFYRKLDDVYALSDTGNAEILAAWLELSIRSGYMPAHNRSQLEDFLIRVGRRKFLTPLYRALIETDQADLAHDIFERARGNYHTVSSSSIRQLLESSQPNI